MRKIRIKEGQTNEKVWGKKMNKDKDMNHWLKGWNQKKDIGGEVSFPSMNFCSIFLVKVNTRWRRLMSISSTQWGSSQICTLAHRVRRKKTELRTTSKPGVSNTWPARRVCVARTHLKNWLNCKNFVKFCTILELFKLFVARRAFPLECDPLINFEFETPVLSCTVYASKITGTRATHRMLMKLTPDVNPTK